jgi:hypothetical protein
MLHIAGKDCRWGRHRWYSCYTYENVPIVRLNASSVNADTLLHGNRVVLRLPVKEIKLYSH